MRRIVFGLVLSVAAIVPARAVAATAIVSITASPNPAVLGDKVAHVVRVGTVAPLDVWVSATGFDQPRMGTLPPGQWRLECCFSMTENSRAWHYRSGGPVVPGSYHFRAPTRARGTYTSTAVVASSSDAVSIRIT